MCDLNMPKRKLVWLDLETGGLNGYQEGGFYGAATYPILEIACFVTDLEMSEDIEDITDFEVAIHASSDDIAKLHPWALEQHTKSGLLDKCRQSDVTLKDAEGQLIQFLKDQGVIPFNRDAPDDNGVLIGNSIGFDRDFIRHQMPALDHFLHYQMVDLSGFKYAFPEHLTPIDKAHAHTALSDIRESFKELQAYREQLESREACRGLEREGTLTPRQPAEYRRIELEG